MLAPPTSSSLFPYTTLFRSRRQRRRFRGPCGWGRRGRRRAHRGGCRSRRGAAEKFEEPRRLRSEEHTSELQSRFDLVCRLLLEKKKESTFECTYIKKAQ